MLYQSSRSSQQLGFEDILLNGLSPDGGLYSPVELPTVDLSSPDYKTCLANLVAGFAPGFDAAPMIERAYKSFRLPGQLAIANYGDINLLDLTQGPTYAFKDFAMVMLAELIDVALARRNQSAVVLGATSGDTGSAAISALQNSANTSVVMLHPHGRTSEIQRRQMTTVLSDNVTNLAVDGSFDDCQDLVKRAFKDAELRGNVNLVAVNSINFARILVQMAYHAAAANQVAHNGKVDVCVPTGNFGNVLAAWYAKRLGAPIDRLIVGTNSNDAFCEFLANGTLGKGNVAQTLSPSMDIQIPSNLERLIWEASGQDSAAVAQLFADYQQNGSVTVPDAWLQKIKDEFVAIAVDDDDTTLAIAEFYAGHQKVIDPHTAVGVAAANKLKVDNPVVVCETASPAKFPDAITQALPGVAVDGLEDLLDLPERFETIGADYETLSGYLV